MKTFLKRISPVSCLHFIFTLMFLKPFILCEGHEMCANGLSLVKLKAPLQFCSSASQKYGCCTKQYDGIIKKKFDNIMEKIPGKLGDTCASYIKEMLCHICHPLSGHSFETIVNFEIPGLCPKYCMDFFQKCSKTIEKLGEKSKEVYLKSKNSNTWCKKMESGDIDYCFPEVKTNKKLMQEMSIYGGMEGEPKSSSKECVCFKKLEGEGINPTKLEELKDGSGRLLVAELPGILSLFYANGTKEQKPYFDIVDYINRKDYEDQHTTFGLPSFALHPLFNSNGKLYITYAKMIHGELIHRLSEFVMTAALVKPEKTERILMEIHPPYKWHNLNDLFFGVDGYLYILNGDGGIQGDPDMLAQNGKTFFGKILRIDVDSESGDKQYGIPPDNPFVDDDSFAPEVFAYGLRNPWRCGLDTGHPITGEGKGRLFCGDVGYNKYEEIDLIKKGGNYGWNGKEGFACYDSNICNKMEKEEFPIFAYNHKTGKSIIGGEVYRGKCIPHLQGKYIFGDYYKGYLSTLKESNDISNSWIREDLDVCDQCPSPLTKELPVRILSFGRNNKGEVYIMATDKYGVVENAPGKIFKIVKPDAADDCEVKDNADKLMNPESETDIKSTSNIDDIHVTRVNTIVVENETNSAGPITVPDTNGMVDEILIPSFSITPFQSVSSNILYTKSAPSLNDSEDKSSLSAENLALLTIASGPMITSPFVQSETTSAQFTQSSTKMSQFLLPSRTFIETHTDVKQSMGDMRESVKGTLDQKIIIIKPSPEEGNNQNKKNVAKIQDVSKIREFYANNGTPPQFETIQVFMKISVFTLIKLIMLL